MVVCCVVCCVCVFVVFFQAEDGIRDLVRSRGLGDVYKRQIQRRLAFFQDGHQLDRFLVARTRRFGHAVQGLFHCRQISKAEFGLDDLSLIHI